MHGWWLRKGRRSARWPGARGLLLAAALWGGGPHALAAQASPPVPLEDRAYELLDRLAAQLAPAGLIHGQRPYTRREFARLALELEAELHGLAGAEPPPAEARLGYLGGLLNALKARYSDELTSLRAAAGDGDAGERALPVWALDGVRAEGSLADSPLRGFAWNGLGSADDAQVNPLLDYRFGRELSDGATTALEAGQRLRLGTRAVVWTEPRLAYHAPRGSDQASRVALSLRTGAARASVGGWALQVGRSALRRGQGRQAGLLFSDNAPPLDMIYLESERLRRLPWIFGAAGPWRFSAHFVDLGPEQNFPHAKLYGNWLHFRPSRSFELGGGFIVHDGGRGAPEQSLWQRIADYLIFIDPLRGTFFGAPDFQASNKIAGWDFRWWLPERGAVVYGEMYLDDFDLHTWRRIREILWPDAAHIVGLELPRLDGVGRLSAWAEYHHVGIRMYRHYDFRSGVVRGRFLLGNALGSDAHALVGGVDFAPSPSGTFSLQAAWERRGHDEWTAPDEPYFHFRKVEERPREGRARLQLGWDHRPFGGRLGWRAEAGVERVRNFDFEEGQRASHAALRLVLEWTPGR